MKVAVFLAASAANADWTPPVAIGRPNPLPLGFQLPPPGRPLGGPPPPDMDWKPPAAIGSAPPMPPGLNIVHGQSMTSMLGPPRRPQSTPPADGWTPPVAIGAPNPIPEGINFSHGRSMRPRVSSQSSADDEEEWQKPEATGQETPLPSGFELQHGESMQTQQSESQTPENDPSPTKWTPPVAQGAPPVETPGINIVHGQSMIKAENVDHVNDAEHHEGTEGHYHDVPDHSEVNNDPSPSPEPQPTNITTESTAVIDSAAATLPLSIFTVLIILAL